MGSRLKYPLIGIIAVIFLLGGLLSFNPSYAQDQSEIAPILSDPLSPEDQAQYDKGMAAYDKKDYETSYKLWLPLAERGYAAALNAIGVLYRNKAFSGYNFVTGVLYTENAANKNYSPAQYNLAIIFGKSGSSFHSPSDSLFWLYVAHFNNYKEATNAVRAIEKEISNKLIIAVREKALGWLHKKNHPNDAQQL